MATKPSKRKPSTPARGAKPATSAARQRKRKPAAQAAPAPQAVMMQPMLAAAWIPIIPPESLSSISSLSSQRAGAPRSAFESTDQANQLFSLGDIKTQLERSLTEFLNGVKTAIDNAATLEVRTFVSDSVDTLQLTGGKIDPDKAQLRALTAIRLDGDIDVCVPIRAEQVDEGLWEIHKAMVAQAQANRTEVVKLAISAVSGILNIIKPV
ncbi:MAG: hypothetical protein HC853_03430 [Anaerolineae bacterium]|nr:hypothetical protein [Anaerolineae bacterium]